MEPDAQLAPRVLLAVADTNLRHVIANAMRTRGYSVSATTEAGAALMLAESFSPDVLVVDLTSSANHAARHVPGAWWITRARLHDALQNGTLPREPQHVVLTCGSSLLARFAAEEVSELLTQQGRQLHVLDGGNAAWFTAGQAQEKGTPRLAGPRDDRYRRPYEGTDNASAAMQAYLDWEFGLIDQLNRDGTHFFKVLGA